MKSTLSLYNTLSRRKERFEPLEPPFVGLYVCGPTVYGDPHLGHARPAVTFDLLFRYLKATGYKVRYVRNITDVGHLEHDADEGEVASTLVGLEDLMGNAREGSVDLLRVHADRFDVSAVVHAHPFRRMGADDSQRRGRQGSKPRTRTARCRIRAEKKPLRRTKACSWLAPFSRGCSEVSALSVSLYRI